MPDQDIKVDVNDIIDKVQAMENDVVNAATGAFELHEANGTSEVREAIVPQLLPIEKNNETRRSTVLTNIVKMLTERKLLDAKKLDQNIKKILTMTSDDYVYKIPLDYPDVTKSQHFIVKLIYQKITSISKSSGIADFLNQFKTDPKIIVVGVINMKLLYGIKNDSTYPNTEIFLEKELMINIVDHVAVPKHYLLSEAELKSVLENYHAKRREIPEILITDPITRYYNAKVGEMFRIIRPSETAGEAPYYRLVVRGMIKE
jgi:DNA-directed RNA polymerase subunit H (RpoH/RPB5)